MSRRGWSWAVVLGVALWALLFAIIYIVGTTLLPQRTQASPPSRWQRLGADEFRLIPTPRSAAPAIPAGRLGSMPSRNPVLPTGVSGADGTPRPSASPTPAPTGAGRAPVGALRGTATWYDNGPGIYAAAGPALRAALGPHWRGRVVTAWAGQAHISVRLVDWCACRSPRVIDLSAGAFARLAPLGRGVLKVTLRW